jgi:hypothetical protein
VIETFTAGWRTSGVRALQLFRTSTSTSADMPPPSKEAAKSDRDSESDGDTSSDEDFNPDVDAASEAEAESVSSSEDEPAEAEHPGHGKKGGISRKRKRNQNTRKGKPGDPPIELDSGDEVTIQERKRRRRKARPDVDFSDAEDDGQGGFVRTRAQRRVEQRDRRPLANTVGSTVDVDSVWARLAAMPIGRTSPEKLKEAESSDQRKLTDTSGEDYITIKRTIKFAGEVTTEEKRVHKESAEAKLYLQEKEEQQKKSNQPIDIEGSSEEAAKKKIRRPLKRLSRFEPNPLGEVKTLPPHLQLRWPRSKQPGGATTLLPSSKLPVVPQATKLNTVDKSRYDWAGFVDKEGIADELDEYGKSKANYTGREDFLNRAQNRQEQAARDVRIQPR